MSIKEMFAKCLMKIQGVSQEKAIAIIELYPTPCRYTTKYLYIIFFHWLKDFFDSNLRLINEYSKCKDEANRVKMIGNLKYGSQQRLVYPRE